VPLGMIGTRLNTGSARVGEHDSPEQLRVLRYSKMLVQQVDDGPICAFGMFIQKSRKKEAGVAKERGSEGDRTAQTGGRSQERVTWLLQYGQEVDASRAACKKLPRFSSAKLVPVSLELHFREPLCNREDL